jgi:DNA-directed RNA polymerase specialized sigma24 family protein
MTPGMDQDQKVAFTTTHWTVVLTAGRKESPQADGALESLCKAYWYPLYAFIRRRGYEAHEAQDLTQEFFARLLQKDYLRAVDPKKGKFRSFLLAALEHFLANEWRRGKAQKRGGNVQFISLDDSAEQHYSQTQAIGLSAEKFYAQQWATTILDKVLNRLKDEFAAAGKGSLFNHLKIFLAETRPIAYADLASALNTTEPALKMAVTRLRQRYAEMLREEIAGTVSGPGEIEQELRELFAALSP